MRSRSKQTALQIERLHLSRESNDECKKHAITSEGHGGTFSTRTELEKGTAESSR